MRIAQVAPLTEAVPPKLYGGTERVVHWLTEELVALGHDVTLFASGDSRTSAKLEAIWPRALRLDGSVRDPNALHMVMLERVRRKRRRGVRHPALPSRLLSVLAVLAPADAFLTTLHGRLDLPEHQPVFTTFSVDAGHLDLERAAPAGAAGELGPHHPSRPAERLARCCGKSLSWRRDLSGRAAPAKGVADGADWRKKRKGGALGPRLPVRCRLHARSGRSVGAARPFGLWSHARLHGCPQSGGVTRPRSLFYVALLRRGPGPGRA